MLLFVTLVAVNLSFAPLSVSAQSEPCQPNGYGTSPCPSESNSAMTGQETKGVNKQDADDPMSAWLKAAFSANFPQSPQTNFKAQPTPPKPNMIYHRKNLPVYLSEFGMTLVLRDAATLAYAPAKPNQCSKPQSRIAATSVRAKMENLCAGNNYPLVVLSVEPDSAADLGTKGLMTGDRIISVNGTAVDGLTIYNASKIFTNAAKDAATSPMIGMKLEIQRPAARGTYESKEVTLFLHLPTK